MEEEDLDPLTSNSYERKHNGIPEFNAQKRYQL